MIIIIEKSQVLSFYIFFFVLIVVFQFNKDLTFDDNIINVCFYLIDRYQVTSVLVKRHQISISKQVIYVLVDTFILISFYMRQYYFPNFVLGFYVNHVEG